MILMFFENCFKVCLFCFKVNVFLIKLLKCEINKVCCNKIVLSFLYVCV